MREKESNQVSEVIEKGNRSSICHKNEDLLLNYVLREKSG